MSEPAPSRPWSIVGFALALRLAFLALVLWGGGRWREPDSSDYLRLATNLRRHQRFARDLSGRVPDIKRGPGYPSLLALTGAGLDERGEPRPGLVLVAQALLGAGACLALWSLALALGFDERTARAAALLLALDPLSITYAALALTETLFTALALAGVLVLARDPRHPPRLIGAGLLFSAAALTRPIGLVLFAPLALAAIGRCRGLDWKRKAAVSALALMLGAAPALGWLARNRSLSGRWTFSTIAATNLLEYHAAGAAAADEGRPYLQVRAELRARSGDDDPARTPELAAAMAEDKTRMGWRLLGQHKGAALKQGARALAVIALSPGAGPALKTLGRHPGGTGVYAALSRGDPSALARVWRELEGRRLAVIGAGLSCGLMALLIVGGALLGLVAGGRAIRRWRWWMVLVLALLVIPAAGPEAEPRFRVPLQPGLCLLAAPMALALIEAARRRWAGRSREEMGAAT